MSPPRGVPLASVLALCFLAAVVSQCPNDVLNQVQFCLITSDIFSIFKLMKTVEESTTFCEVSVQKAYDCVARLENQCDPNATNTFTLMVDSRKIGKALTDFCLALPDLMKEPSCFDNPSENQTKCLIAAAQQYAYEVDTVKKVSRRHVMDLSCVYYEDMKVCFMDSFPEGCHNQSAIFGEVFAAMEYPYCSLGKEERAALFPIPSITTTSPTTDAPTVAASLSLLLSALSLCLLHSLLAT